MEQYFGSDVSAVNSSELSGDHDDDADAMLAGLSKRRRRSQDRKAKHRKQEAPELRSSK